MTYPGGRKTVPFCSHEKDIKVCPVTGLRVLQRPEWTDVSLSKGCRVTLSVVGDNVLLVRSVGYAALDDVRGTVALIRRVVTGSNRQGNRDEFTI